MKPVPAPKRLGTAVVAHSYELPRVIRSVESEHGLMAARAGRGRGAASGLQAGKVLEMGSQRCKYT